MNAAFLDETAVFSNLNFLRSTLFAAKPQWGCWDSNPEPKDYESSALTVELQPQVVGKYLLQNENLQAGEFGVFLLYRFERTNAATAEVELQNDLYQNRFVLTIEH